MLEGIADNRPEVPIVVLSFALSCKAEGLARVSTANNVGSCNCVPVNFFDVSMIDHRWPVFFKYFAGKRVYF